MHKTYLQIIEELKLEHTMRIIEGLSNPELEFNIKKTIGDLGVIYFNWKTNKEDPEIWKGIVRRADVLAASANVLSKRGVKINMDLDILPIEVQRICIKKLKKAGFKQPPVPKTKKLPRTKKYM